MGPGQSTLRCVKAYGQGIQATESNSKSFATYDWRRSGYPYFAETVDSDSNLPLSATPPRRWNAKFAEPIGDLGWAKRMVWFGLFGGRR